MYFQQVAWSMTLSREERLSRTSRREVRNHICMDGKVENRMQKIACLLVNRTKDCNRQISCRWTLGTCSSLDL